MARRELENAKKSARGALRKFEPHEILQRVQVAVQGRIDDKLKRNDVMYDERTGVIDLRNTRMGLSLGRRLNSFAQGNKSEGEVRELTYNSRKRQLAVRLYVRHCHSWGKYVNPLGDTKLYEVRQTASLRYNFGTNTGNFDIEFGNWAPSIRSRTVEQIAEGNLIAAAESLILDAIGRAVGVERVNKYNETTTKIQSRHGPQNIYFASQDFVGWASPDNLRRYAISGIITGGASVSPTMRKVQQQSLKELSALAQWLSEKGLTGGDAQDVARNHLTGQPLRWPFLKFDLAPVRYSARERNLGTPWRHEDHLGFVVIWDDRQSNQTGKEAAATSHIGLSNQGDYADGKFKNQGNQKWVEERNDGTKSYFRELERGAGFVRLYDDDRKRPVQLTATQGLFRNNENEEWQAWGEGGFR
ncbi:hypothetical protein V5E97_30910 [Singulisphaera sp. Ch08]|uniref:Uncharacterized protein n=1 Tax=Singulisphaera sp. Ch08 TaxID=3120278 RepID=A0AAU7CDB6_9BACT